MPILYNTVVGIGELIYIFAITIAMDSLVKHKRISNGTARKVIHLWMGGLIVFWFLFSSQYAQLIFSIPVLVFIIVMLSAMFNRGPHVPKVLQFARAENSKDVAYGPLIFMVIFIFFTIFAFRSVAGVAALCAVVFGDGVAPIAGKYACVHYANGRKSVEGSIGFFMASLISIFIFTVILIPGSFTIQVSRIAVLASIIGAITEGVTPGKFDNLTVPLLVWFIFLFV